MSDEIEGHITAVETFYRPIICGPDSRLIGGARLWRQYEDAREAYRRGATDFSQVYERINEMAAAYLLLSGPALDGATIAYEAPIAADGSLIDFTVSVPDDRTLYVEVKTVRPSVENSEASWSKYEKRSLFHPEHAAYIARKDWLGGKLYGDSFSARSHFMDYTRQFEERLAAANGVRPGDGVLLLCGTGLEWHLSELEDFADFYQLGVHRKDDPFAKMEAHALANQSIKLRHNIGEFACMRRSMDSVKPKEWHRKIQGLNRAGFAGGSNS